MNMNFKIPAIGAGGAGILSLLIGGIFKVSFPLIIIRALVFAAVAFGMIYLIIFLVSKYLSELLMDETSDEEFSENSSDFGIEQNGEMGVEYKEEANSSEGAEGARLSGDNITIDVDGDDEGSVVDSGGVALDSGSTEVQSESSSPYVGGANVEEFLGNDHDPEEIAKSIRTVLKRDEKGSG